MVGKRGALRIAEAAIAIIIVISFLILVQVRNRDVAPVDFSEKVQGTLEEIAKDSVLRKEVFNQDNFDENGFLKKDSGLYSFIRERIPENYLAVEVRVCEEIDRICSLERFIEDEEIYAGQRVIVPTVEGGNQFDPKKLAIFVYRE